ncbi:hypothetical protein J5226_05680 [Lysobacter sp. K5869]|uniref:DUF4279 domain-containing protein n=1 Tax=Lysobacter sp. K5869 TaxID=2820808 RepID=UPI001C05EE19|nr:DUF4279 domain-containing protein [Lysobacter sp. K5869]QWP77896.1 hypothetical protein J5226_05680 [Lysobacter sp. K5869]
MNPYRYRVSLRLRHPDADLSRFGQTLGLGCFSTRIAGEPRLTPKGHPLPGTYRESTLAADLTPGPAARDSGEQRLEDFLAERLRAWSAQADALRELRDAGGSAECFIGVFLDANSGMTLDPALLARAGELGIALALDLYPPDRPDRDPV